MSSVLNTPHEIALGVVYLSPTIVVVFLAVIATLVTVSILNRLRISKFFLFPNLSFLAFLTLYAVLIDHFFIRF